MKIILKVAKLKALRKSLGYTQKEFGEKAGVAESTYRNWELGGKTPSTFHSLYKLCEALKIDPRDYVENPEDLPAVSSSPKQEFEELLKNINAPDGLVNLLKFHASLSPEARKKINKSLNEKLDKTLTDIIKEL